jgi:membrane-bound metal-dependent hydrolase YbcI (DUF457 family)
MPITPLHYPVAYVLSKLHKKLTLPGLTVGAMFPDLEVPLLFLLFGTDRLVLHSLLGAATIGTMLSVTFTVSIYPILISYLFGIDVEKVKEKTRLSLNLIVSCLLGNLSHILLDFLNHLYNPLLWPLSHSTLSPICLALGGLETSFWIVSTPLIVLFVTLLITQREKLWEKLLVGE